MTPEEFVQEHPTLLILASISLGYLIKSAQQSISDYRANRKSIKDLQYKHIPPPPVTEYRNIKMLVGNAEDFNSRDENSLERGALHSLSEYTRGLAEGKEEVKAHE